MTPAPALPAIPATLAVDTILGRVEANLARMLVFARPACASEPESYDLADAEAAHAELQAAIRQPTPDVRTAADAHAGYQPS